MIIRIKQLRLRTIIGIFEWEKKVKQDIVINLAITFDGSQAAYSDDIAHTVDYKALKLSIMDFVETRSFGLIETLVTHIADLVLSDPKVSHVSVEIEKPGALRYADSVSVSLEKSRP